MPRKKVNWELEWFKIHNPPEQFYFKFGKTVLLSNNLFHTPTVTTNSVLSTKVVEKIFDWESANKISKKRNFEWLDIIKPIVDLLKGFHFFNQKTQHRTPFRGCTHQIKETPTLLYNFV